MSFKDKFEKAHTSALEAKRSEEDRLAAMKTQDDARKLAATLKAKAFYDHVMADGELLEQHGWKVSHSGAQVNFSSGGLHLRVTAKGEQYVAERWWPNAMRDQDSVPQFVAQKPSVAEIEDFIVPILAGLKR